MNDSDRIDHLLGQVAALKAFCMCVALVHDRPAELQKGFEKFSEVTVAKMLPTQASDSMLEGIEHIKSVLATVLQDAANHQNARAKS